MVLLAIAEIQSFTNAIIMIAGVQMIIIITKKTIKLFYLLIFDFSKCVGNGSI